MVPSPCISVCDVSEATGYCRGCFRNLGEIANWLYMNDAQKEQVIAALDARKPVGFTLIEVSIVLVLLSLGMMAVFAGRELLNNARYQRQISQIAQIQAAVQNFNEKYHCYPGDCLDPTVINGYSYTGNGDGFLPTTWNGDENKGFWQHLSASGVLADTLVNNSAITVNMPKAKINDLALINAYGSFTYAQNVLEIATSGVAGALKTKEIVYIERKVDDLKPATGSIRSSGYGTGATTVYSAVPCFPLATSCNTGSARCITATDYVSGLSEADNQCNMLYLMGVN